MDTGYNARMSFGKMQELKDIIRQVIQEELGGTTQPVVEQISGPEQRILDATHWLEENTGKQSFKPSIIAYFARFLPVSPAFVKMRQELIRKGMILVEGGGYLRLTDEGKKKSKPVNSVARGSEEAAETV